MKVTISTPPCIGCGQCMDAYPEYFSLNDRCADYIGPAELSERDMGCVLGAMALCPSRAIQLRG